MSAAPPGKTGPLMHDFLPLLAKLPIVVAAMIWAVRELVLLKRDEKARSEAPRNTRTEGPAP
jgi:hypothetical protein